MARFNGRRRSRTRFVTSRKRELNVVRGYSALSLTSADNVKTIDLLNDAELEASGLYKKDLTPSTVAGVKFHYSWFTPVGSDNGFLGIGLINESRRQTNALAAVSEAEEGKMSPLDLEGGMYWRWHARWVEYVAGQGSTGHEISQQLADNDRRRRVRSNRKLFTVDDTYYLIADTNSMSDTVTVYYDFEIWLKKP